MLLRDGEATPEPHLRIFSNYGHLPEAAYRQSVRLNEGIAGHVAATGKALLVDDIAKSPFASRARHQSKTHKGFMSAPIVLHGTVIGVVNAHDPVDGRLFGQEDLALLNLLVLFLGKLFEVARLQNVLNSRYAQLAMVSEAGSRLRGNAAALCTEPAAIAKIVAKTFYTEMTRAGFSAEQVVAAATEILGLLGAKLEKHRQRQERAAEAGKNT